MKKIQLISAAVCIAFFAHIPVIASGTDKQAGAFHAKRAVFEKTVAADTGIDGAVFKEAKNAGFSHLKAFMFSMIAKETGLRMKQVLAMHESGMSWQEICESKGVNYEKFMKKVSAVIAEKKLKFPDSSEEEDERDGRSPGMKAPEVKK